MNQKFEKFQIKSEKLLIKSKAKIELKIKIIEDVGEGREHIEKCKNAEYKIIHFLYGPLLRFPR